jgi:hypothetical protein
MSISTVIAALQSKHRGITGIASAPTAMPASINTAAMPIVLCWPGPATWDGISFDASQQTRTYIVRVYVQPVGQGQGVDEGYQDILPLLQAFGAAYMADPYLSNTVFVIDSVSDAGLDGTLMFAGVEYRGFEFRINVVETL